MSFKDYDHKLVCVSIKLDKAQVRMSGNWEFNSSLCGKDFQGQLELILKWKLTEAIIVCEQSLRIELDTLLPITVGDSN